MIVTGAGWVNHTEATVHDAITLPRKLVIHILGPGHLVFSCGLTRVMETIGGKDIDRWLRPVSFQVVAESF